MISYKTLIGANPFRIRFGKTDGFVRVYDRTGYWVLFASEKYDAIYNRIRYLIGLKSSIIYVLSQKNSIKILDPNVDNIFISKLMEKKNNSKVFNWIFRWSYKITSFDVTWNEWICWDI